MRTLKSMAKNGKAIACGAMCKLINHAFGGLKSERLLWFALDGPQRIRLAFGRLGRFLLAWWLLCHAKACSYGGYYTIGIAGHDELELPTLICNYFYKNSVRFCNA